MNENYWKKIIVASTTTAIVLAALLIFTGFERSISLIIQAEPLLLLLGFILANSGVLVTSFIWKQVFESAGITFSYPETVKLVLSNTFLNNITPFGHAGGEPVVAYHLSKKTSRSVEEVLSAIIVSDFINFSYMILSAAIGLTYTFTLVQYSLLSAAVLSPYSKAKQFLSNVSNSIKELELSTSQLIKLLMISQITLVTETMAVYTIILSIGVETGYLPLLLILPLARLANYVPTPGGSGPYEIALSGLLVYFTGVEIFEASTVAVIYRSLTFYFGIIAGSASISTLEFQN
jgi:uncharacterized membrane protein YbhN (UPF0104 family)